MAGDHRYSVLVGHASVMASTERAKCLGSSVAKVTDSPHHRLITSAHWRTKTSVALLPPELLATVLVLDRDVIRIIRSSSYLERQLPFQSSLAATKR